MHAILQGFGSQLRQFVAVRKYRIMFPAVLLMAWVSMDVYHRMVIEHLPIAVVDRDNSKLSRTIRSFIMANRELEVTHTELRSLEQARGLLNRGEIAAAVLLPSGLSADLKHGRKVTVPLAIDMSNILVGKTVYKAMAKTLGTVAAGAQLTLVKKLGERKEKALARTVPITISENLPFNPATNYAIYVTPGLIFFLLHILVLILTFSIFLPENRPPGIRRILGAMGAIWVVSMAIGLIFFYLFLARESIRPQASGGLVAGALALFIVLDIMLTTSIYLLIRKPLLTVELTLVFGMLSLMFSGITWPMDMFPPAIAAVAYFNPFTPFAQGFQIFLHFPIRAAEMDYIFIQYGHQALLFSGLMAVGGVLRREPRQQGGKAA